VESSRGGGRWGYRSSNFSIRPDASSANIILPCSFELSKNLNFEFCACARHETLAMARSHSPLNEGRGRKRAGREDI